MEIPYSGSIMVRFTRFPQPDMWNLGILDIRDHRAESAMALENSVPLKSIGLSLDFSQIETAI